jgi:HK97 family phage major capsid protein
MPEIELKELLTKQNEAFDKFKNSNDARIKAIEEKGFSDPLLEEKVDKANVDLTAIAKQMAELEKKLNRPGAGKSDDAPEVAEHKAAYGGFLRKGKVGNLEALEMKALNVTTDADGGYAMPIAMDSQVLSLVRNESPMRQECTVRQIGGGVYKQLVNLGGTGSGWVDEDDERTETGSPKLTVISPSMGEIYANPAATQTMLDDSLFDAEGWLTDEISKDFAEKEGAAFISGTGVKQPKGILAYTSVTTADATRAFGQLQHLVTAAVAAITSDELMDLIYMLKKGYRTGAKWMANSAAVGYARKLKDSDGQYLWAPGLEAGQPATMLGYAMADNEDMADIGAGNVAVAFGNFKRGYLIADRFGIRTLRDPYTNKPYVHFYTTKRVGGCLLDSNAIKLLQQKAS